MTTISLEREPTITLQGHYAGAVTRLGALLIDVLTISVVFTVAGQVAEYVISLLRGDSFSFANHRALSTLAFTAWVLVYLTYPLAVAGRTFGLFALGLRVVRTSGQQLDARHAIVRVIVFLLTLLFFGIGFLLILVRRDRRALHDLAADTAVVYDWDARAARLRFLARHPGSTVGSG